MSDLPFHLQLWDAGQCAEYLRVTRPYFLRSIARRTGFPQQVPGSMALRVPLWKAADVTAWMMGEAQTPTDSHPI